MREGKKEVKERCRGGGHGRKKSVKKRKKNREQIWKRKKDR